MKKAITKQGSISKPKLCQENRFVSKTIYNHVDLAPGAGKTELFVDKAIEALKNRERVIVYAAPTIKLLAATYARFFTKLDKEKLNNTSFIVISRETRTAFLKELRILKLKDKPNIARSSPINLLNLMLGLVSHEQYKKSEGVFDFIDTPFVASGGTIIFTTHTALSSVRDIPKPSDMADNAFGGSLRTVQNTHVYFDEARDCVIYNKILSKLKRWQLQAFLDECDFTILKENEKWKLRKITKIPHSRVLKDALGIGIGARLPQEIIDTVSWFKRNVVNGGRNDLLICDNLGAKQDSSKSVCAFGLLWPGRVFKHYREVTFLSAFFKTSEMFHMLKEEKIKSEDLVANKKIPASTIKRDRLIRANLFKRSEVATLCDNYKGMRGGLSSNQLRSGLLIPVDKAKEINAATYGKSKQDIINELVDDPGSHPQLRPYAGAPIIFLAMSAISAYRRWRQQHGISTGNMLTVLNSFKSNSDTTWHPSGLKFRKFFQAITHRNLLQELRDNQDDEEGDDELHEMTGGIKSKHLRFLTNAVHKRSKDRVMEIPDANQLHGLNRWDELNAFCYLAAIVPPPHIEQMYALLIPGYDAVDDSSIENLVQTMMRINLRRPEGKGTVLLVLPFAETVTRLANKITKDTNLGDLDFKLLKNWKPQFSVFNPLQEDLIQAGRSKGGIAKRGYSKYGSPFISKAISKTITAIYTAAPRGKIKHEARLIKLKKLSTIVLAKDIEITSPDDIEYYLKKIKDSK